MAALLDLTLLRGQYTDQYRCLKHQRDWIIELDRCFEPDDEQGQRRTVRQVKPAVTEFLERLTREAAWQPGEAKVIAHIVKAVRHRWWGLFTCYRIPNVPSSNNDLETFFKDLKHHQRRITGRKSVREFACATDRLRLSLTTLNLSTTYSSDSVRSSSQISCKHVARYTKSKRV